MEYFPNWIAFQRPYCRFVWTVHIEKIHENPEIMLLLM